jgi:hypothetical protein
MFIDEMAELRKTINQNSQSVSRLCSVIEGMEGGVQAHAPNSSRGVATVFPIGYLPSSFRFPVGLTAEDCWQRWHCKQRPLRAITVKMLPDTLLLAERARQSVLRRKIKGVMEILQGTTPNRTVDIDVDYVWKACWARCVTLFGIREPCSLAVTTLYDWLLKQPDKVTQAREAPPIALHEAATAAAENASATAHAALGLAAAVAANPPVRSVSAAAGAAAVAANPAVRSVSAAAGAAAVAANPAVRSVSAAAGAAAVATHPPVMSAAAGAAPLPANLAAAVAAYPPERIEVPFGPRHEAVLYDEGVGNPPLIVSAHSAVAMVQLQVIDAQISEEQVPDIPDRGVACKHCKVIFVNVQVARRHHERCPTLKYTKPRPPCASWTGCRLDHHCLFISRVERLGNQDHYAADAALRRFHDAEQSIASNHAIASAAAADALLA